MKLHCIDMGPASKDFNPESLRKVMQVGAMTIIKVGQVVLPMLFVINNRINCYPVDVYFETVEGKEAFPAAARRLSIGARAIGMIAECWYRDNLEARELQQIVQDEGTLERDPLAREAISMFIHWRGNDPVDVMMPFARRNGGHVHFDHESVKRPCGGRMMYLLGPEKRKAKW